jgi:RNA polymerase sigma-70 factor (ECF subfamily)
MSLDGPSPFHVAPAPGTLDAARRGDHAALATIHRLYARPAYNLALRMLGDAMAAEDVVQDVFERLARSLGGYRGDAPFGAWLRRAVANGAVDELRRRRWLDLDTPVPDRIEPAGLTGVDEVALEAWQLLDRLEPTARAVLVLHAVEGLTHAEMAVLFGRSESYTKSLLSRALVRLRSHLAPETEARNDPPHDPSH